MIVTLKILLRRMGYKFIHHLFSLFLSLVFIPGSPSPPNLWNTKILETKAKLRAKWNKDEKDNSYYRN